MRLLLWVSLLSWPIVPLCGHALVAYVPVQPMHVEKNALVDAAKQKVMFTGVNFPGLEAAEPVKADMDAVQAMNGLAFRIINQRWNDNAVRLPVSPWIWKRDGQSYLDQVGAIVAVANRENLVVILAAYEDAHAGSPDDTGLPGTQSVDFWKAAASYFKDRPAIIFSIFNEPSTRNIPGAFSTVHRAADWQLWRDGGALTNGHTAVGMQALVDAIRGAGATHVIAVSSFHDSLDFQGFKALAAIQDANVMYEMHPYFDHGSGTLAWDSNFGFLAPDYPLLAGAWGMPLGQNTPACRAIPADMAVAENQYFQLSSYLYQHAISWTAADFRVGSLLQDYADYTTTYLNGNLKCDETSDPSAGLGDLIMETTTGDPHGFGSIDPTTVASLGYGFGNSLLAPGELIALFGQTVGPATAVAAQLDQSGKLPTSVAETQVLFDGVPAPILMAGYYQTNVQVPFELAGKKATVVQLIYHGVPSNAIELPVADANPAILTSLGTSQALVINGDGTLNDQNNPAPLGSMVSIYATGCGVTSPPGVTGAPSGMATLSNAAAVQVGGRTAEVLYAGAAPGEIGVTQLNVRVPLDVPLTSPPEKIAVMVTIAGNASRQGVILWAK